MSELSFRDWVKQKTEDTESARAEKRKEWGRAYRGLKTQIETWLKDDGGDQIRINDVPVVLNERGIGQYQLDGFFIGIGDSSVKVTPIGRNVIGHVRLPGGGEISAEGLADITGGGTRYHLYRTIQDGQDRWYVVEERRPDSLASRPLEPDTPLTRERFQAILMELMA